MRNFLRYLAFSLSVVLLTGCKEHLPVQPLYSTDDGWAPGFEILWSGYQRVYIRVEGPPRRELLRNIVHYVLEARSIGDTIVSVIDTFRTGQIAPSYVGGTYRNQVQCEPRLEYNQFYELQLAVHYVNGTVRRGPSAHVQTGTGKGRIVSRLSQPVLTFSYYYSDFNTRMVRWKDKLLYSIAEHVYSIDTTTGSSAPLMVLLPPAPDWEAARQTYRYRALGVSGDTLIAALELLQQSAVQLFKYDLGGGGSVDSTILIDIPPDDWVLAASVAGDKVALLFSPEVNRAQIRVYRTGDGTMLQEYPAGSIGGEVFDRFYYDGIDFWLQQERYVTDGDNEFRHLDPNTLAFGITHRIPVYNYYALSIDWPYLWVQDYENRSIVKVVLEGY